VNGPCLLFALTARGLLPACPIVQRTAEDTEEPRVFDAGVGTQGEEGIDVLAIGVHYGFSFKLFHRR